MNIIILGVSGFIGHHLYDALCQHGHHVTGYSRRKVPNINWQEFDFTQSAGDWSVQLQDIDIVINAVGIYEQSEIQNFYQIHEHGPKRIFEACRKNKVRVLQISAIGAEQNQPVTEFLQSKRNADQYLLSGALPNVVLYPGIVLGEGGNTTRQLSLLARLFCVPLAFGGDADLPLISIHQLTDRIVGILNNWPSIKQAEVVIAKPETMRYLFGNLRQWMGLGKGCFISLPRQLINQTFQLLPKLSIGAFNKQSVDMLSEYSSDLYTPIAKESASDSLLKNKATDEYIKELQIKMLFYINIISLGIIWVVSGLSSLINIEQSRELIVLVGVDGIVGDTVIIAAALGDILLGVFLWVPRFRQLAIYIQIGVMLIYTIIISLFLPGYWLHPFAPIIKNLAMFVLALYVLIDSKDRLKRVGEVFNYGKRELRDG